MHAGVDSRVTVHKNHPNCMVQVCGALQGLSRSEKVVLPPDGKCIKIPQHAHRSRLWHIHCTQTGISTAY